MGQLNAHTLLHTLLPSLGEVPQHLDDVVIIIRDELLAQRSNRAGIYPSRHTRRATRVVEGDLLTHGLQQVIEEVAPSDELLACSARLQLQESRHIHAVLALGVDGAGVQV